jgi:DMSO/TMAO reductase YedYZ molybdopterin-dependent catalytic subunit
VAAVGDRHRSGARRPYHARIPMRPEAQALYERLFGNKERDAAVADRIPPGQYRTEKFPVLHYGSVPKIDLATWDFKVYGLVDSPFTLTWQQFRELPRKTVATDIHCVTRWTKLDTTWEGVPIQHVLELAQLRPSVSHVLAHSEQGYTANLPLSILDDDDVLLADTFDGQPLEPEHGYPLRLLVPKRYFWKSAKWLRGLEFLDHDQLGFWERYGYHNDADPWKEERYSE